MKQKILFVLGLFVCLAGLQKACAHNLVLNWNASASSDVAGYNVYFGTNSGNYLSMVNAGSATSVTISNLAPGLTYFFVATAYDASGNESSFSGEISFVVPGVLTLTQAPNSSGALIQFPVESGHWYEVQASADLQNWTSIWQSAVATSNYWMQYTDANAAAYASRFYRLILH